MNDEDKLDNAYFYEVAEDSGRWLRLLALLLGLAIGLSASLYYAWQLYPVEFYNTDPVDLRSDHQKTWILLVSAAYRLDGNLERANARLTGLQDPQISQRVAKLTTSYISQGQSATRIRALALLADALGARTPEMLVYLATPEPSATAASATVPATATPSPSPTARASPTMSPPILRS